MKNTLMRLWVGFCASSTLLLVGCEKKSGGGGGGTPIRPLAEDPPPSKPKFEALADQWDTVLTMGALLGLVLILVHLLRSQARDAAQLRSA